MKSPKEIDLEQKILVLVNEIIALSDNNDSLPLKVVEKLIDDEEIQAIQDYANTVSIVRLGFNDHGPVHMRTVCRNSLKMLKILHQKGIKTSLETEGAGSFCDSVTAIIFSTFFHDFGMTVGRQDHELYSGIIGFSMIKRILEEVLPGKENIARRTRISSLALEGILGHMGTRKIHSLEAGLVLIADGLDMTKGRARIPLELNSKPSVGDIHKYSANSIEKVVISSGEEKPIKIQITMSAEVGFFQIEEVLFHKIDSSPAKNLIELYAGVENQEIKKYL